MPRTYSQLKKMRADLAWVTETQTRTSVAAATFDAVRKPALNPWM